MTNPILIYDGECPLCHHAVLFFLRIDIQGILRYTSLQGEFSKSLMKEEYPSFLKRDTVILYNSGKYYFGSDAFAFSLKLIPGYQWLGKFICLVPQFIREPVYRMLANNRKKIFGACPIIPDEYKPLFL